MKNMSHVENIYLILHQCYIAIYYTVIICYGNLV